MLSTIVSSRVSIDWQKRDDLPIFELKISERSQILNQELSSRKPPVGEWRSLCLWGVVALAPVETQQRLTGNEPETGEQEFAGRFEEEA